MLGLLALASLVLEYGFHLRPRVERALELLDVGLASLFGLELLVALARHPGLRALRERWYEYALLGAFLLALAAAGSAADSPEGLVGFLGARSITRLYLVVVQVYVFSALLVRFFRAQERLLESRVRPEALFAGGFALLVLIGTLLLLLPRASARASDPLSALDAFFTSTSAVCVTGLTVRDTGLDLSPLGQLVVLFLFQIGGLGIVTFVAFGSIAGGRAFSVPQTVVVRETLNARTLADVRRHVLAIVLFALALEAVGALVLFLSVDGLDLSLPRRLEWAVFHSVSAFCNAGFSLESTSLQAFRGDWPVSLTVMTLIVLGGLGTPVLRALAHRFRRLLRAPSPLREPPPPPMRLQARLALVATGWLLLIGFVGFLALEGPRIAAESSWSEAVLASLFQSVTPRTAGFDTDSMGVLREPTLVLVIALMVIGASPVSTGGGIKTLSLAIVLLAVRAMYRGRDRVEAYGRTLPRRIVQASIAIFVLYAGVATLAIFLLALFDPQFPLRAHAFEAVSALSTVGLSLGTTASLSAPSKVVLCALMFLGRVGPLTLVIAIFRSRRSGAEYEYPEETVVLS